MKLPFSNLSNPNRSPIAFRALRRTNLPAKYDFGPNFVTESPNPQFTKRLHLITLCSSSICPKITTQSSIAGRSNPRDNSVSGINGKGNQWKSEIRNPVVPPVVSNWGSSFSLRENTFLLLAVMASMTSMAFISLVAAAVPTLYFPDFHVYHVWCTFRMAFFVYSFPDKIYQKGFLNRLKLFRNPKLENRLGPFLAAKVYQRYMRGQIFPAFPCSL